MRSIQLSYGCVCEDKKRREYNRSFLFGKNFSAPAFLPTPFRFAFNFPVCYFCCMNWHLLYIVGIISFAASYMGTGAVLHALRELQIMDLPNPRSNHLLPTPRGGGIAVTSTVLIGLMIAALDSALMPALFPVIVSLVLLGLVSWRDDLRPLSGKWRLLAQIACVTFSLRLLFHDQLLFHGILPPLADKFLAGLLWVWFINLYNFMDGIDGITGSQTLVVCTGIIVVAAGASLPFPTAIYAAIIGAAAIGFLCWNWHPARLFLGDVGSIPLGYAVGWLLLSLAYRGYWPAALILPAYYLADSGITLARRIRRRERIWEAHSQHFYQRAARAGKSHSQVVLSITLANILLLLLALASTTPHAHPMMHLALAAAVAGGLILILHMQAAPRKD